MKRQVILFENRDDNAVMEVSEKPLFRALRSIFYCGEKLPAGQYLWRRTSFGGDVVEGRLAEWLTFEANTQKLREGSERMSEMIRDLQKAIDNKTKGQKK